MEKGGTGKCEQGGHHQVPCRPCSAVSWVPGCCAGSPCTAVHSRQAVVTQFSVLHDNFRIRVLEIPQNLRLNLDTIWISLWLRSRIQIETFRFFHLKGINTIGQWPPGARLSPGWTGAMVGHCPHLGKLWKILIFVITEWCTTTGTLATSFADLDEFCPDPL